MNRPADSLQVMRSIKDNITEDVLLNDIYEIICLPMYADRIRIESKAQQHANAARRKWSTERLLGTLCLKLLAEVEEPNTGPLMMACS